MLTWSAVAAEVEQPLYLIDTPFQTPMLTRIFTVNPADGSMTLRADLGETYSPFFGLAAASESILYAAGTDNSGSLCSSPGCLLLRITLDPASTNPVDVTVVGPMSTGGQDLGKVTGLTFRSTGDLYGMDQDSDALYIIETDTAQAVFQGTINLDIHGGDLTFTDEDRLFLWTNLELGAGIYEIDPATAVATAFDLDPPRGLAGMAALGHSSLIWGAGTAPDALIEIDAVQGLTSTEIPLSLAGSGFDHKRGDLDSPYCTDDLFCDDANACTGNICTAGGCRLQFLDLGQTTCGTGACEITVPNCQEDVPQFCVPGQPLPESCDGLDNDCDGLVDNNVPPPTSVPGLSVNTAGTTSTLAWTPPADAGSYDIVRGDARLLHASQGDYSAAAATCLAGGLAGNSLEDLVDPMPGEIFFYLVRPGNCGGPASFDSQGPGQKGSRDTGLLAVAAACP